MVAIDIPREQRENSDLEYGWETIDPATMHHDTRYLGEAAWRRNTPLSGGTDHTPWVSPTGRFPENPRLPNLDKKVK